MVTLKQALDYYSSQQCTPAEYFTDARIVLAITYTENSTILESNLYVSTTFILSFSLEPIRD